MNGRFVVRGTILALVLLALVTGAAVLIIGPVQLLSVPEPTPPRPTIDAPRGEMPAGSVGLRESAQYGSSAYTGLGCGFLLRLSNGQVVGVTTAHSLSFSNTSAPLKRIGFSIAGRAGFVAEFDTLHGQPGQAQQGEDMTIDYVLLQVGPAQLVDPELILAPDPRGAPQPGERVAIYSGLGDGNGSRRVLEGTVQSVNDQAVWVVMDDAFEPGGMSGSPFVSEYTGRAIGMTIATTHRAGKMLLGLHPIGSIVRKAEAASEFPKIADYRK
jgi:hypothetical protein